MKSGNPVLDKNLDYIAIYNPQLKEKLLNLPYLTNKIDMVETELKEPNLSFNNSPLHNQAGAEAEAQDLFKRSEDNSNCIHVIFGIGLGYLFKEFCDNAKGPIILYEPNLDILRVTLELVDFSQEFLNKKIKVASDFFELKSVFSTSYQYKAEINFLFLNSYGVMFPEEIEKTLEQLQVLKAGGVEQYNNIKANGLEYMLSIINNLTNTLDATPLKEYANIYEGKTALIVSAGPTLDSNIEIIKKNRNKFIIFCVGTAFKALANNGITPDFLNVIEMSDCSGQIKGYDLSDVSLIMEPSVNSSFQKLKVKKKFLFPSSETVGAGYWAHFTKVDISGYSAKAGTVSFEALESARMLGFKKMILVGQDLACVKNQCYSKYGSYSDMVYKIDPETNKPIFEIKNMETYLESCSSVEKDFTPEDIKKFAESKLKIYNGTNCFVEGITGEMIPTLSAYSVFIGYFKEYAHKNPDLELINTSLIGAQIDGFKNMQLDDALKGSTEIAQVDFRIEYKYDKQAVLENLKKEIIFFEQALMDFRKPNKYLADFIREYNRKKKVNSKCIEDINLIIETFDFVALKYFNNSSIYNMISLIEYLEFRNYADTTTHTGDVKVVNFYNLLKTYFSNVEGKILKLKTALGKQVEVLSQNIDQEQRSNKELLKSK